MGRRFSRQRLEPMIQPSPTLKAIISPSRGKGGNEVALKTTSTGWTLMIASSRSAAGLRSLPARVVQCDEVDSYVQYDGPAIPLALPAGPKNSAEIERGVLWPVEIKENKWIRLLAYVTGLVNQELLLQNEFLAAENRILRAHLPAPLRLSDPERSMLAELGKRLGRRALAQVASVAKPDTILAWYRKLIAHKFDGSKYRRYPGAPNRTETGSSDRTDQREFQLGVRPYCGHVANLGYKISDQTVGNVLKRHGIPPAPKRSQTTTWKEFIQSHMAVLAGIDFFSVEVLT
jgi:hypothetical protein